MNLTLKTAPASEPITAADAKVRLGIGSEVPDAAVTAWIKAARQLIDGADGQLGRALLTQTLEMTLGHFPCDGIRIPLPPLQQVDSVVYDDSAGDEQTLDESRYRTRAGVPSWLVPARGTAWPRGAENVRVTFTAGYADGAVPEPIVAAIVLQVSHMRSLSGQDLFKRSESVDGLGSIDWTVSDRAGLALTGEAWRLLSPYRV